MKKLALGLLLLPSFAFASFDTNLKYGSTGSDVLALQEFLTEQGVYTGPISGNFYSLTLAGVKAFQKEEGIQPVSGFVGPITRGVMNDLLATSDSEGNATTTQPIHSLATTTPVPQIVYVPILTPMPQSVPQSTVPDVPIVVPASLPTLFATNDGSDQTIPLQTGQVIKIGSFTLSVAGNESVELSQIVLAFMPAVATTLSDLTVKYSDTHAVLNSPKAAVGAYNSFQLGDTILPNNSKSFDVYATVKEGAPSGILGSLNVTTDTLGHTVTTRKEVRLSASVVLEQTILQ